MIEAPTAGRLLIGGKDMTRADATARKAARPLVQMVFQNPYGSLNPRKRIGTMLEEPLAINTSLSAAERRERAQAAMARVGLRPEHYRRFPHMFSGGQRQRVAVARALMLHPRLVVADEPVSALDVSIQAQVLNLLMDLQDELSVAYLFISHNLAVVEHIAHDVLVMYLGKIVESAPKRALFERPLHPYTRALLASTPSLTSARGQRKIVLKGELPSPIDPPPGCTFHKRCPYAIERCRVEVPGLRDFGAHRAACHRVEEIEPEPVLR
jgi:dipeptide transport system ATP-binding protein